MYRLTRDWVRRRVAEPVLAVLRIGVTPEKIALSIALGLVLGVFPVFGITTLLCLVAAFGLRLNVVVMELFNYLAYPLHIALLVPFLRLGERILRLDPIPIHLAAVKHQLATDTWGAILVFARAEVRAIVGWLPVAPLAIAALYFALAPLLRRIPRAA